MPLTIARFAAFVSPIPICSGALAIVGGALDADQRIARHVVLVASSDTTCTGVVIASNLILTAAQCIKGSETQLVEFDATGRQRRRPVARVVFHPQFDYNTLLNHRATADIALLQLNTPLPAELYSPALLVDENKQVSVGDPVLISGYGVTTTIGDDRVGGSVIPRNARLEVTGAPGKLQIRLFDPVTRNQQGGLGACSGDSGAPAFDLNDKLLAVVGLVSWSTGPLLTKGCGGFTGLTPLASYRNWIVETAALMGSPIESAIPQATRSPNDPRFSPSPAEPKTRIAKSSGSGLNRTGVPLKMDGGIFVVPVQINGTMTLDFVIDSGAADVSVPADVVSTLMRAGTIKETDFIGQQTYVLADGSKSKSVTFTIRSLRLGDMVLVRGSVASSQGSLLLGQSFLEHFKSWSIDNTKHELFLEPR
jgi:Trypsin/gag-polyprotein putative aspartyl protease